MLTAAQECAEIAEHVLFLAEHTAEVIACAGGEWADGDVIQPCRTADALIEGAVPAAGVDVQLFIFGGVGLYLAGGVHGSFGDVNFICIAAGLKMRKGGVDTLGNYCGFIAAAGSGVDYKKMLHLYLSDAFT